MKYLTVSVVICAAVLGVIPGHSLAAYWDVTFTAESVWDVGMVDDGENILQGDPDLFFAMQIQTIGSGGELETMIFNEDNAYSSHHWNFQDKSVSLTNVYTSSSLPPEVWFRFWLFDDDGILGDPDLLGIHSFSADSTIASTSADNNNSWDVYFPSPLSYEGSGWPGNFTLNYSVTFENVTPTEVVPLPAALWMFGSGLIGLIGIARRGY